MQGRIVWYRPDTGEGVLVDDSAIERSFRLEYDDPGLQGGDLIRFGTTGENGGMEVQVIERWVDHLNDCFRPLVNQFHSTVAIRGRLNPFSPNK